MTHILRRMVLALAVVLLGAAAPAVGSVSWAAPKPFMGPQAELGDPKAPVTVIEYASASCPHCARFNNEVLPAFKAKYVDTGKVHYIFRELLTQPQEFAAAGFLTARCAGKKNYLPFLDDLFHQQLKIYESGDLLGGLTAIGKTYGLTQADITACLKDKAATEALDARLKDAEKAGVASTPTFFINGKKLEGEQTLGDLMMVIEPLLASTAAGGHG